MLRRNLQAPLGNVLQRQRNTFHPPVGCNAIYHRARLFHLVHKTCQPQSPLDHIRNRAHLDRLLLSELQFACTLAVCVQILDLVLHIPGSLAISPVWFQLD